MGGGWIEIKDKEKYPNMVVGRGSSGERPSGKKSCQSITMLQCYSATLHLVK